MRRESRAASRLLAALMVLHLCRADVVFRVPEVMVRHAAASRPVGTGSTPLNTTKDGKTERQKEVELIYEEYYVEHEVSTLDARNAAGELNLEEVPETRPGCGVCTKREMEYCEVRVVEDHCCCERRFVPEPFPWLPHICYVGRDLCKPTAHDCARYVRLRDCCCYKRMAGKWKNILSSSDRVESNLLKYAVTTLILLLAL